MKKKIVLGVIALLMTAGMAIAAGGKVEVNHKGDVLCVSASAANAHVNHGDTVNGDCTKKKKAKRKTKRK